MSKHSYTNYAGTSVGWLQRHSNLKKVIERRYTLKAAPRKKPFMHLTGKEVGQSFKGLGMV